MVEVEIVGGTGEGTIWRGQLSSIPSIGETVFLHMDSAGREVKEVNHILNTETIIIRVR